MPNQNVFYECYFVLSFNVDSFVYLLLDDKSIPTGTTSNISSPFLSSVPLIGHCVEFNYALIADGEIDISVHQESKNGTSILLQKLDVSRTWNRISLFLEADEQFNPFRVSSINTDILIQYNLF